MGGMNGNHHPNSFPIYNQQGQQQQHQQPQQQQLQQQQSQQGTPTTATSTHFLSPIPSPVLDPQLQQSQNAQQHYQFQEISQASQSTSPNGDVDMLIGEAAMPTTEDTRRPSKRKTTSRNQSGRVKQSPIVKAQSSRRKSNLSATIPSKEVSELLDSLRGPHSATSMNRPLDSSNESASMNSSASPESLSDMVMGPPPKPASALQSPNILPHGQQGPMPATPANLLLLKTQPQGVSPLIRPRSATSTPNTPAQVYPQPSDESQPMLEDLTLPDPAAPARPELTRLETAVNTSISPPEHLTPRMTVGGRTGTPVTAGPSPNLNAMSPNIATPTSAKPKATKGSRKRSTAGAGSQLVSPALRPKISPSIAPMLPTSAPGSGGTMSPATPGQPNGAVNINASADYTTLLLASKSNYQNILDGTFAAVPGVSYPGQLTESLNSKRTSHKLAEQGRRNRINLALKELESLIGGTRVIAGGSPGDDLDKNSSAAEKSSNSKAATVESAIEFIRGLQKLARERDEEIGLLRAKLKGLEKDDVPPTAAVATPVATGATESKDESMQLCEQTQEMNADGGVKLSEEKK